MTRAQWPEQHTSMEKAENASQITGRVSTRDVASPLQFSIHSRDIEFAFPVRDDDCRDVIADQVGECARLRHETIDAEDQRDGGDRNVLDRGKAWRRAR